MKKPLELEMEVEGVYLKNPEKALPIWEEEILTALEKVLAFLHGKILPKMPESVTGYLRGSVFTEIRGKKLDLHGVIASPAKYAMAIEKGYPIGKFPNIDAIRLWARSVFGRMTEAGEGRRAYLIARAIYRKGYREPHKKGWGMFEKTFKEEKSKVIEFLDKANARVVKRLEGTG